MTHQLELSEMKRAWIDEALTAFNARAFSIGTFCADELHQYLPPPDHDGWWGCFVAKLRCAGRIKEVGRVKSTRPERNGAKVTLWQVVS
jgi:hypothetical protein